MSTDSKVIIEAITSDLLRGNPLGDSPSRRTPVYLPPGYDDGEAHYPVIYLLAGFSSRGLTSLNDSIFDENIQERMDRLIVTAAIQPMIVVLPDCSTRYGGSQYINSIATGPYEDYLVEELVPYIDRHYRTRPGSRAVAGKSSGGYGALVLGMRHPEIFSAVASHSGDMYFEYGYKPDFPKFLNAANRLPLTSDDPLKKFFAEFLPRMYPKPSGFFDLLNIGAMAACYSPNPASPYGFDLPFNVITGELRPEVWERWLAHDPVYLLDDERHAEALRQMKLLYLDCGNRDEYALHYGARIFCQRLTKLAIPYVYEEFDGGHGQTQFRYDRSLTAISNAFLK
jgi:enterochelin esterase family protein